MASIPKGNRKCTNGFCKNGYVPQFDAGDEKRLKPTGTRQCGACGGRGYVPDPKYIARLVKDAGRLELDADKLGRDANGLIGTGRREVVRDMLNDARDKRTEAQAKRAEADRLGNSR